MIGVIKNVDYNEAQKQSLLHFECNHIDPIMRNDVLSFVYNMLPQNEKEVLEALEQTEEESENESENKKADSSEQKPSDNFESGVENKEEKTDDIGTSGANNVVTDSENKETDSLNINFEENFNQI